MQISQPLHCIHRLGEIDASGVGEIVLCIRRHLPDLANPLARIGGGARKSLGAEDQQAQDSENKQLSDADVEHGFRLLR